ncbi:MAG: NADH:ubiquinone oxidoreductase [Deltaproteobacteria bacterium HGW-Deltaproteobacteria-14]|jgi:coenzyme F420-reducing hydrogenase gamma subunit|nr:MAG: NADH:ubiquinone oxidoreductase [Deltaproteobacteria bacterium HGW-Deltaproteobacteria-14]
MKPKIAFFDFASCEGCQLAILNVEDALLDLLERVDIVEFREALSEKAPRYDIAFIEGSIHREEDADRLRDIRARSRVLVALGACAAIGNVQARSNATAPAVNLARVYGEEARDRVQTDPDHWPLWAHTRVRPISDVVEVDYYLRGCPVVPAEFVKLVTALIAGSEPRFAREPVCTECKRAGNLCVFARGETCLGQVTWAGCGAICVTQGYRCDGCRGLLPGANLEAHRQILRDAGLDDATIDDRYDLFCSAQRQPQQRRGAGPGGHAR